MMIVLVCGEKGGTGKTTLATNLAAMRAASGRDVLLIDTDPQGSASFWAQVRDDAGITPRVASIQKFGKGLTAEIKDLVNRYQDIIIDAGGRENAEMRAALVVADIAVIPLQASQFDLWTVEKLVSLVETARGFNPNLKALAIISRAPTTSSSTDANEAQELISEHTALTLGTTIIRDRVAFRRAAGNGQSVVEYSINGGGDKSSIEMKVLFNEVFV
jgi:chromosome partitioning protein